MDFDLDAFTEEELIALNHCIVNRLRLIRDLKAHESMINFRPGERVVFHPEGRDPVVGTLMKFNRKSVTVMADSGMRWTVAPSFLRRAPDESRTEVGLTSHRQPIQLSLIKS
jgi:hypothetical protein